MNEVEFSKVLSVVKETGSRVPSNVEKEISKNYNLSFRYAIALADVGIGVPDKIFNTFSLYNKEVLDYVSYALRRGVSLSDRVLEKIYNRGDRLCLSVARRYLSYGKDVPKVILGRIGESRKSIISYLKFYIKYRKFFTESEIEMMKKVYYSYARELAIYFLKNGVEVPVFLLDRGIWGDVFDIDSFVSELISVGFEVSREFLSFIESSKEERFFEFIYLYFLRLWDREGGIPKNILDFSREFPNVSSRLVCVYLVHSKEVPRDLLEIVLKGSGESILKVISMYTLSGVVIPEWFYEEVIKSEVFKGRGRSVISAELLKNLILFNKEVPDYLIDNVISDIVDARVVFYWCLDSRKEVPIRIFRALLQDEDSAERAFLSYIDDWERVSFDFLKEAVVIGRDTFFKKYLLDLFIEGFREVYYDSV